MLLILDCTRFASMHCLHRHYWWWVTDDDVIEPVAAGEHTAAEWNYKQLAHLLLRGIWHFIGHIFACMWWTCSLYILNVLTFCTQCSVLYRWTDALLCHWFHWLCCATVWGFDNDGHIQWPWRPEPLLPQTMTTNLVKFIQRCEMSLTVHLVLVFMFSFLWPSWSRLVAVVV